MIDGWLELAMSLMAPEDAAAVQAALEPDLCKWPGCDEPALCQSGNFGNRLVCAEHFRLTNGPVSRLNIPPGFVSG